MYEQLPKSMDQATVAGLYHQYAPALYTVSPAVWSPDSQYIAFPGEGNTIHVYKALTNTLVMNLPGTDVGVIAWSPDGKYIALGDNQGVEIYDATKGKLLYTYKDNASPIAYLVWSPNSKLIASVNFHGPQAVNVWVAVTQAR